MLVCTYENNANRFDDTRRARASAESGGAATGVHLAAESAVSCPAGGCAGCERGPPLARNEINQHPSGIAGAEERQAMNEIILNPTDSSKRRALDRHPVMDRYNSRLIADQNYRPFLRLH